MRGNLYGFALSCLFLIVHFSSAQLHQKKLPVKLQNKVGQWLEFEFESGDIPEDATIIELYKKNDTIQLSLVRVVHHKEKQIAVKLLGKVSENYPWKKGAEFSLSWSDSSSKSYEQLKAEYEIVEEKRENAKVIAQNSDILEFEKLPKKIQNSDICLIIKKLGKDSVLAGYFLKISDSKLQYLRAYDANQKNVAPLAFEKNEMVQVVFSVLKSKQYIDLEKLKKVALMNSNAGYSLAAFTLLNQNYSKLVQDEIYIFELAQLADQLGNHKRAIELMKVLLKKQGNYYYYNNIALYYFHDQNYTMAQKYFDLAIIVNPDYERALYNRAYFYSVLQKYSESLSDLNKLVKLSPKNALYYFERSLVYLHLKQKEKACEDISKSIEFGNDKAEKLQEKFCN